MITKEKFDIWLEEEKSKIKSMANIPEWILDNQKFLMNACNELYHSFWRSDKFYLETDLFESICFDRMSYTTAASNTHVAPDGRSTNFLWSSDLPRGYPGWRGNISGKLHRDPMHMHRYPYSDLLNFLNIKTGSGGGGNANWRYDFTIFIEDWKNLQEEATAIECDWTMKKLKGNFS